MTCWRSGLGTGSMGLWALAALALAALDAALAQEKTQYFGNGGTLRLGPPAASAPITSIAWRKDGLVAEWIQDKVGLTYYGTFKGRAAVDTTTGVLEIRNASKADGGVYTVEINLNVQDVSFRAQQIEEVPAPSIWVTPLACNGGQESCRLRCEGATAAADPVSYSWKGLSAEWADAGHEVEIPNNESTQRVVEFRCRMKNPISEKASEPFRNPFYREEAAGNTGLAVGLPVALVITAVAVGGLLLLGWWWWRKKRTNSAQMNANGATAEANSPDASMPLKGPTQPLEERES